MLRAAWLLLARALADVDWIAWTGQESHGRPGSEGWLPVPRGERFEALEWESAHVANAYRYFYPGATHYTVGDPDSGKLAVNVWQPFSEGSADPHVGANLRAALFGLYRNHLDRIFVKVSNVGYSASVNAPLCEDGAACPIAMLIDATQLPQRVASDRILPLDLYIDAYLVRHLRRLPDEFQRSMYYDYQFGSRFMGVPFITDVRLLGFNRTTLQDLGMELPPPYGRLKWSWEDLRHMACAITEKHGVAGLVANSDWDEDAKLFVLMLQAAHGALFRTDLGPSGLSRQCNLGIGERAIETFWKPMISRGCLKASGNRNYWGIDASTELRLSRVCEEAVSPRDPPEVWRFSNYMYKPGSETFGLFIAPGLDENLAFARCHVPTHYPTAPSKFQDCAVLQTRSGSMEAGLAACRQEALRLGADTVATVAIGEKRTCELLRCQSRTAATAATLRRGTLEVHSRYCSEILYASMPESRTYRGGTGLVIPTRRGTDPELCSNVSDSAWLEKGQDPPACWEHSEGWRLISELIDPGKPYMRQANTLKQYMTLPPLKDLSPFETPFSETRFWEPVAAALSQGLPSQYPNSQIPQYAEMESLKPIRIALLRSIYGNITAAESLQEACGIVDEILRPCNRSEWTTDPRCRNPVDGLQGCPPGTFYKSQAVQDFGLGCTDCPPGRYEDSRSVDLGCKLCPVGLFSNLTGSTACRQCAVGMVAQQPGLAECAKCPSGRAPEGTSSCIPSCPAAAYQFGLQCRPCPSGTTSIQGSTSSKSCTTKTSVVLFNVLLVLVILCMALLLPLMLGRPIPIDDIHMEEDCVVVKTWGRHRMFRWSPLPLRVQLQGTQHPKVEDNKGMFQARVRDRDEIWLLDCKGNHITHRIDCSRGSLRLLARSAFFGSAIGRLPVGLVFAGLCACLITLSWLLSENADAEIEAMPYVLLALFVCLSLALFAYWYWSRQGFETPLARKQMHWRQKLLQPDSSDTCERGPSRAISAGKLFEFHAYFQDAIRKRDMHYVVSNLLLSLTEPEKLSYAELAGPSEVQWFVSHCWSNSFADMVESLRQLATSLAEPGSTYSAWHSVSFWICSFSMNQWQLDDELGRGDPMASSFNQALRSKTCKGTAMVLDENAEPLRRSWCLFEVFQTCKLTDERTDFGGLLMCTPSGVLQKGEASVDMVVVLARTLATIRMEDAKATKVEDKIMIDSCVQSLPGGFASVNRFVHHCIKAALDKTHGSFEGHFAALVSALEGNLVPAPTLLGLRRSASLHVHAAKPTLSL